MARYEGQLIICKRCKESVFRKRIGTDSRDGGFTQIDRYEDVPGWNLTEANGDLCPDCAAEWESIKNCFWQDRAVKKTK